MSLSVSQAAFEIALVGRYSGFTMDVLGVATGVPVFLEAPSDELITDRVFPSVSIRYLGEDEASDLRESSDKDTEEVDYDDSVFPPERVMRETSDPIRLRYSIDTWHKDRAAEDQVLYHEMLRRRTPSRGHISVLNLDSEPVDLWLFKVNGSLATHDYEDIDTYVYHKSITVETLVYLAEVEYDDVVREKVVEEVHWEVQSRGMVLGSKGMLVGVESSEDVTDVDMVVTVDSLERL